MPDSSLSQAIKEAYASAPSDALIFHTLEFRHPAFTSPIRVVRDYQQLNAKLEATAPTDPNTYVDFIPFAFDFSLPNVEEAATPEITIAIDNVSQEIETNLALAVASPYKVEVTYRPYLASDLTQPQMNPPLHLVLTAVEATDMQVIAHATFGDLANKRFPGVNYTATLFPGLIR